MDQSHLPSLCEAYRDYFYIGAAVNEKTIRTHDELIRGQFNSITAENSMKFESLQPAEGVYDFTLGDELIRYAGERGLRMRGHTMVWHNQTPDWVYKKDGAPASRALLLARMEEHIKTVAEHFTNPYAWDVVNEAVDDREGGYLRSSEWHDLIGDDFIEKAFLFAGKYVKNGAKLFYNDYNESVPDKCRKICRLVRELKETAPIGGLGLQGHYNPYTMPMDEVKRSMEAYAELGVTIHITELDVPAFDRENNTLMGEPTAEMRRIQEEYYEQLFALYRDYREVIECVTLWGVADDATWLSTWPVSGRENEPLLFDRAHQPKPALERILRF